MSMLVSAPLSSTVAYGEVVFIIMLSVTCLIKVLPRAVVMMLEFQTDFINSSCSILLPQTE